jgi:hypothetical protein
MGIERVGAGEEGRGQADYEVADTWGSLHQPASGLASKSACGSGAAQARQMTAPDEKNYDERLLRRELGDSLVTKPALGV